MPRGRSQKDVELDIPIQSRQKRPSNFTMTPPSQRHWFGYNQKLRKRTNALKLEAINLKKGNLPSSTPSDTLLYCANTAGQAEFSNPYSYLLKIEQRRFVFLGVLRHPTSRHFAIGQTI